MVMTPWTIFLIGSILLTLVIVGWDLLPRRKHNLDFDVQAVAQDARLLKFLIWLALLSVLAYIAFAFGKR